MVVSIAGAKRSGLGWWSVRSVLYGAEEPTVGGDDFCLLTETPIAEVRRQLGARDIEILAGPVERTGAVGPITSVYFRDPDDNLVEIARYSDA